MSHALPHTPTARRHDLDWIRVGAFFLLILYHVGVFYESTGWHVTSPRRIEELKIVMELSSPWRLTLLFLVAGAATRFMADKMSVGRLTAGRTWRLLVPLVFGMLVIVPPQTYYEVLEHTPSLIEPWPEFWLTYITGAHDWGVVTPTWNHLWFVAYLWVYTLVLALALACAGGLVRRLGSALDGVLKGWGLFVWPILYLALVRQLAPMFDSTHALVDDWHNHALFLSTFLLGFLIARSEVLRDRIMRHRWTALTIALCGWTIWQAYQMSWTETPGDLHLWSPIIGEPPAALRIAMRAAYAAFQWGVIVAILGFGSRHLDRGGPILRYLTLAVFPLYILHQTITVVAAHHLAKLGLPIALEAGLLIAITFGGAFAGYEAIRRVPVLRPLFGLKYQAANRPPRAA